MSNSTLYFQELKKNNWQKKCQSTKEHKKREKNLPNLALHIGSKNFRHF